MNPVTVFPASPVLAATTGVPNPPAHRLVRMLRDRAVSLMGYERHEAIDVIRNV
jgi:hypothetical protein